jgi:hypothetical protein
MIRKATASRETSRDSTVAGYRLPLVVFSGAFALLIATMSRNVGPYDEGVILFGSTRVLSGEVPYRVTFMRITVRASSTSWRRCSRSSVHRCSSSACGTS